MNDRWWSSTLKASIEVHAEDRGQAVAHPIKVNTKQAVGLWSLLDLNPGCRFPRRTRRCAQTLASAASPGPIVLGVDQSAPLIIAAEDGAANCRRSGYDM